MEYEEWLIVGRAIKNEPKVVISVSKKFPREYQLDLFDTLYLLFFDNDELQNTQLFQERFSDCISELGIKFEELYNFKSTIEEINAIKISKMIIRTLSIRKIKNNIR